MPVVLGVLVRLLLLAAALVVGAGLLTVALVGAGLWVLHAAWARLSGRQVRPMVFRMRRGAGVPWAAAPRAAAAQARAGRAGRGADVTDVEPK